MAKIGKRTRGPLSAYEIVECMEDRRSGSPLRAGEGEAPNI